MPKTWYSIHGCPLPEQCNAFKTSANKKKKLSWHASSAKCCIEQCVAHLTNSSLHRLDEDAAWETATAWTTNNMHQHAGPRGSKRSRPQESEDHGSKRSRLSRSRRRSRSRHRHRSLDPQASASVAPQQAPIWEPSTRDLHWEQTVPIVERAETALVRAARAVDEASTAVRLVWGALSDADRHTGRERRRKRKAEEERLRKNGGDVVVAEKAS